MLEKHFKYKETNELKGKGWKKLFHENIKQKKVEGAVSISDKINFRTKNIPRNKRGTFLSDKDVNSSRQCRILNVYASNNRAS